MTKFKAGDIVLDRDGYWLLLVTKCNPTHFTGVVLIRDNSLFGVPVPNIEYNTYNRIKDGERELSQLIRRKMTQKDHGVY